MKIFINIVVLLFCTMTLFSQVRESNRFNEFSLDINGDLLYINDSTLNARGGLIPVSIHNGEGRISSSSRSYLSPVGHVYRIEGNKVICKKSGVLNVSHNYAIGKDYYIQFEGTYDTIPFGPNVMPAFTVLDNNTVFIKESIVSAIESEVNLSEYRPFKGILNYAPPDVDVIMNWTPGHDSVEVYTASGKVDSIEYLINSNIIRSFTANPSNHDVTLEIDSEGRYFYAFDTTGAEDGGSMSCNSNLAVSLGDEFTIVAEYVPTVSGREQYWFTREEANSTGIGVTSTDLTDLRAVLSSSQGDFSPNLGPLDFSGSTTYIYCLVYEKGGYRMYIKGDENEYTYGSVGSGLQWDAINIGSKQTGGNGRFSGKIYSFWGLSSIVSETEAQRLLNNYDKYK